MTATIPNTESWETIKEYLEFHKDNIEEANNREVVPYIMPIFGADITNEPTVMMQFHRWLDQHVSTDLRYIVGDNIDLLKEANLNNYKFKIILGMRGPMDEDLIIEFVKMNYDNETVKDIAKHKNFPAAAREMMYEHHQDVDYLPQEALDIFVF